MNALEIVQSACREMALPVPNTLTSATDKQTQQMFALLNAIGDDLRRDYEWQQLIRTATITTDGGTEYPLPADYDRRINQTEWDESNRWRLVGPVSPQAWQWLQSSSLANTGPRYRFRVQGNQIEVHPDPSSGLTYKYQYISRNWVVDGDDATGKSSVTKDTDTFLFRDRILICGVKLRFYAEKGLNTDVYRSDFYRYLEQDKGHDSGAPMLSLKGTSASRLLNWNNIPDGNYGS